MTENIKDLENKNHLFRLQIELMQKCLDFIKKWKINIAAPAAADTPKELLKERQEIRAFWEFVQKEAERLNVKLTLKPSKWNKRLGFTN